MAAAISSMVAVSLTAREKDAFLANFFLLNPHQHGAHVDDVLEMLHDTDSHCGELEELAEAHESEWRAHVSGYVCLAVKYIHPNLPINWEVVKDIQKRIK